MHLRSVTLKGFKSFPDRTKLDFSPGVSVVVGPNGSGKSNITDALLWALGEQSPLAVRGQTMTDVIFAGGAGVASRSAAEVEVVIDGAGGDAEFSELSIVRRLERDGDGEYRMNGARCRLADIIEALSDTGLGKEMHSVVSQGRVESIIHSKPRDRRLLIEEAAGLGKHRKRRRRAELKLERTQQNLSRALDVEREARSRLRPLKRQAEAAELHARLELTADTVRALGEELAGAERLAAAARDERDEATRLLSEVAEGREQAEEAFAAESRARQALSARLYAARSAADRIGLRAERATEIAAASEESRERREAELATLVRMAAEDEPGGEPDGRIATLESELARLDDQRRERIEAELESLGEELHAAEARAAELESAVAERVAAVALAENECERARTASREAERAAEAARSAAARAGAELAAANQFLRTVTAGHHGKRPLADALSVDAGFERAVAAALGPRLGASLVEGVAEGERLLDAVGEDGGTTLVSAAGVSAPGPAAPPVPGAERLAVHARADGDLAPLVERLLAGVWLVDSIEALPAGFDGIAVTRAGRMWSPASGELHQAPAGGDERVLEQRNRRDELARESAAAVDAERAALAAVEASSQRIAGLDSAREEAAATLRAARRAAEEAEEGAAHLRRRLDRRREAPDEGDAAVARARVEAELAAERRLADRARREAAERERRIGVLRHCIERDRGVRVAALRAAEALSEALGAVVAARDALAVELAEGEAAGERTATELRRLAQEEAQLQERLRKASEAVTGAEVRAQQARDTAREAQAELSSIAERLGFDAAAATEALEPDRRAELEGRIERLARRREQLGPVNPLAKAEYDEAVAYVEELETQREDLEAALTELEKLIRDTDRRIREAFEETFEAAARNFEEVVGDLFPGGRGKLRLVRPEGPRPVIGGEEAQQESASEVAVEAEEIVRNEDPGVEVEVTPAGKSTKRLSLLSGGEKSLVALAFIFAVFLARPCPFYVLDEVEAALDDLNIDRFLQLVKRYSDRAQFIIVTHQKRTMDAADCIYGVSMGADGVSKVVSRRLAGAQPTLDSLESGSEAA